MKRGSIRVKTRCPLIIGERYGELTILRRAADHVRAGRRDAAWRARCSCGRVVTVRGDYVRYYLRKLGWTGCRTCYHALGGWDAIAARLAAGDDDGGNE